ncbi:MAG TPA: hypothetical protein DDW52_11530 [Planctomycetaceae bacterium]|nr:hypothetical protein [Planctomycetaceae bacterium]
MATADFSGAIAAHILQSTIVLVAALIAIKAMHRRLPHLAFLVAMLALAKCLVPPLVTSPTGLFTRVDLVSFAPAVTSLSLLEADHAEFLLRATPETQLGTYRPADSSSWFSAGWLNVSAILAGVWLAGASCLLVLTARQYWRVHTAVDRSLPARRELRELSDQLAGQLGIKHRVRVLVSAENFGPVCVGVIRPTLVLPKLMVDTWKSEDLAPIIGHELVHVRRGDVIWGYLQFFCQVVFWFHPLVWLLGRRAQILCEHCCDTDALQRLHCSAADYAESLVKVLQLKHHFRPLPLGCAMSPMQITSVRLSQLSQPAASQRAKVTAWIAITVAALMILPGMKWRSAEELRVAAREEHERTRNMICQALDQGDWQVASQLLSSILAEDPQDSEAVFYLGYSLHKAGDLDKAIVYHQIATETERLRPIATYNIACVLALKGQENAAMRTLLASYALGFRPIEPLDADADLEILFGREEFRLLCRGELEAAIIANSRYEADTVVASSSENRPVGSGEQPVLGRSAISGAHSRTSAYNARYTGRVTHHAHRTPKPARIDYRQN